MDIQNQTKFYIEAYTSEGEKVVKKKLKTDQKFLKKWTVAENILYARYLKTHMGQMSNQKKKKSGKFIKIANFIGTKTQNQCRSHHQKMLLTYKSIQNILLYVSEIKKRGDLISLEQFEQLYKISLQENTEKQIKYKMEEQVSTQKQSQYQTKQQFQLENGQNRVQQNNKFPILQEQSQAVEIQQLDNDLFDVLNIDAKEKYAEFFTF